MGIGSINRHGLRWLAWLAASLTLLAILGTTAARADVTINVNTTTDETTTGNGTCSLREAVLYANGTAEPDCAPGTATGTTTVTLPSGPYVLTSGALSVTGTTVINGAGAASTTIDANGASQVVKIGTGATVSLNGVTVTGGTSGVTTGICSVTCLLFGRAGVPGGGISNAGTLTLNRSAVTNNTASAGTAGIDSTNDGGAGGGVYNTGTLTITNSTITGNKTLAANGEDGAPTTSPGAGSNGGNGGLSGDGGGIDSVNGTVAISGSTLSGNSTGRGGDGGKGGDGNTTGAGGNGGTGGSAGVGAAIASSGTGSVTVTATTINGNTTGAGGNGGNGGAGAGAAGGAAGAGGNGGAGGAIDSAVASTVQDSTLTGNATGGGGSAGTAGTPGGAVATAGTGGAGGALTQSASGDNLVASTVASNTAAGEGGGLEIGAGGSITIENTIVASNHTGSANFNCGGPLTMYGFRGTNVFFGDNTCGTASGDPKLQPLAGNGGPVQTMALGAGSSAIDVVPTNDCLPTDERGVARPQGPKCDAGAYELAPPTVSGVSAGASSTTTATVIASINPNFKATTVAVRYGTTTAYGTTTPAQNLGSANAPTSFSARLTALAPNTTYHAQVVATNADGTTASGDVHFTTTTSVSAALASASVKANKLSITIVCDHGNPTDRCAGPITLSAHVTTAKGKPVAVSSAKAPAKKKPKPVKKKTRVVKLASSKYSVATGHRQTIKLSLNKQGRGLLNALYKVPATVKLRGTTSATRKVTFSYGRVRSPVSFTWKFNNNFTIAEELTISSLPAKSKVLFSCHGGGCPFAKRTFSTKAKAKTRKLTLADKLKQAHLKPKARVQIEITAANAVGKVLTFTIVTDDVPKLVVSCLVPGARKPTACATPATP